MCRLKQRRRGVLWVLVRVSLGVGTRDVPVRRTDLSAPPYANVYPVNALTGKFGNIIS